MRQASLVARADPVVSIILAIIKLNSNSYTKQRKEISALVDRASKQADKIASSYIQIIEIIAFVES